jgi:hypothetical protein
MKLITVLFIVNASLLLLHEIESAYEKEWEILKLPGRVTGFLLLHIPIILFNVLWCDRNRETFNSCKIIGIIFGVGGIVPLLIHKVLVYRKEKFNLVISDIIIYSNAVIGVCTLIYAMSLP